MHGRESTRFEDFLLNIECDNQEWVYQVIIANQIFWHVLDIFTDIYYFLMVPFYNLGIKIIASVALLYPPFMFLLPLVDSK